MTYEDFMRRYGMLLRVDNINGLLTATESPLHDVTNVCGHHSNDSSISGCGTSAGNTDAHSSPLVTSRATKRLRFSESVTAYSEDTDAVAGEVNVVRRNGPSNHVQPADLPNNQTVAQQRNKTCASSNPVESKHANSVHSNENKVPSNRPAGAHSNSYAHGDNHHSPAKHVVDDDDAMTELYYRQLDLTPRQHRNLTPPNRRRLRRRSCECHVTSSLAMVFICVAV